MIKIEFNTSDCDEFWDNYPNIEMSLNGSGHNLAYVLSMIRDFLLAMGYQEGSINDYLPPIGEGNGLEDHIEERMKTKFNEFLERSSKTTKKDTVSKDELNSEKPQLYGFISVDIPPYMWEWDLWFLEFSYWMQSHDRAMWERYNELRDHTDPIKQPAEFVIAAFNWEDDDVFTEAEWDTLDEMWRDYCAEMFKPE